MSQIINSHYVPLQPPYPIIYCNGEVGMQIATLIVLEGREPSESHPYGNGTAPYFFRSHSHPVVSYGNKLAAKLTEFPEPNDWSEGVVWDRVELRNVTVLCYATEMPEIPHPRLDMLVKTERYNNAYRNEYTFKLSTLLQQFSRFNIKSSLAEKFDGVQLEPKIKVTFIKQTPNNMFLYGLKDGYAPYLDVLLRWSDDLDKMEQILRDQIDDYRAAIAPHELHFTFDSREEEWEPLAERMNNYYSQL